MSKGPGRIQRAILALINAKPDEAFTVEDLCRRIYPGGVKPTRAQLGAVTRALTMPLPGKWTFGKIWPDCRWWLFDASRAPEVRVLLTELPDAWTEVEVLQDWSDVWTELTFEPLPVTEIILTDLPDGDGPAPTRSDGDRGRAGQVT
jgi:hypothetical protein